MVVCLYDEQRHSAIVSAFEISVCIGGGKTVNDLIRGENRGIYRDVISDNVEKRETWWRMALAKKGRRQRVSSGMGVGTSYAKA